jgi:DNA sulfur modification protein DndB
MSGLMGGQAFYVSILKLGSVVALFETYLDKKLDLAKSRAEFDLFTEAQRRIQIRRIPEIRNYILDHPESWVFSALTASFEEGVFEGPMGGVGKLVFDSFERFTINDGQHRMGAIREALAKKPSLAKESIAVVFFKARDVSRMQQIFTDLNRSATKVSGNVLIAMGHKNEEKLTTKVVLQHFFLKNFTELEKAMPSLASPRLFSLGGIHEAHKVFLGPHQDESEARLLEFWDDFYAHMPLWQAVYQGLKTPAEMKRDYLTHQNVILRSFAMSLRLARGQSLQAYQKALKCIQQFSFRRKDRFWMGKAINQEGRLLSSAHASNTLIQALRSKMGLRPDLTLHD